MELTSAQKRRTIRNLIIFAVISLGGGFLGMAVDGLQPPADPMQGLGALLWLLSPLAANLLLRAFGGDGWQDFGLNLNLPAGWVWYVAALVISPLVILVVFIIGLPFKVFSFAPGANWQEFFPLVLFTFVASMPKNIFEEFAWRGYLTPKFESLGLHPFLNSIFTGWIWAGWHIPYYVYYLSPQVLQEHTSMSATGLIGLSMVMLPFQALAYGELRLISKSVWTAWLLHNVANGVSLALVSSAYLVLKPGLGGIFLSPGTEGVFHSFLMGGVGLFLYRLRRKKSI